MWDSKQGLLAIARDQNCELIILVNCTAHDSSNKKGSVRIHVTLLHVIVALGKAISITYCAPPKVSPSCSGGEAFVSLCPGELCRR